MDAAVAILSEKFQKKWRLTFRLFTTFGRHHKETRRVSCRPNVPE
jgi:hypothetical protein